MGTIIRIKEVWSWWVTTRGRGRRRALSPLHSRHFYQDKLAHPLFLFRLFWRVPFHLHKRRVAWLGESWRGQNSVHPPGFDFVDDCGKLIVLFLLFSMSSPLDLTPFRDILSSQSCVISHSLSDKHKPYEGRSLWSASVWPADQRKERRKGRLKRRLARFPSSLWRRFS